jgi:septal ring factor EnvC (AmiA/AmiB activator)
MNEANHLEYLSKRVELEQKRVADLEAENTELQAELRRTQRKVSELEPALATARQRMKTAEDGLARSERDVRDLRAQRAYFRTAMSGLDLARCHSANDGECNWDGCPQNLDGEPAKSGRSCPLFDWDDAEGRAGG